MANMSTTGLPEGVVEHDGLLWKPRRGATTTADEFIAARTLFIELNDDAMWNAWVWDERKDEIDRSAKVMGTWQRAEPSQRQLTLKEWEAQQARRERARERERAKQEKLRESRKPTHDPERAEARLSLLEHQSRVVYEQAELEGFRDGTKFPAMAAEKREVEIDKLEETIERHRAEIDRLAAVVGEPEDVIDEEGWLPRERREVMLLHYKYDRERDVRRLKEELPDLKLAVKDEPDRSERSRCRSSSRWTPGSSSTCWRSRHCTQTTCVLTVRHRSPSTAGSPRPTPALLGPDR